METKCKDGYKARKNIFQPVTRNVGPDLEIYKETRTHISCNLFFLCIETVATSMIRKQKPFCFSYRNKNYILYFFKNTTQFIILLNKNNNFEEQKIRRRLLYYIDNYRLYCFDNLTAT